eukprot:2331815-Amphidinium_carterae.1
MSPTFSQRNTPEQMPSSRDQHFLDTIGTRDYLEQGGRKLPRSQNSHACFKVCAAACKGS